MIVINMCKYIKRSRHSQCKTVLVEALFVVFLKKLRPRVRGVALLFGQLPSFSCFCLLAERDGVVWERPVGTLRQRSLIGPSSVELTLGQTQCSFTCIVPPSRHQPPQWFDCVVLPHKGGNPYTCAFQLSYHVLGFSWWWLIRCGYARFIRLLSNFPVDLLAVVKSHFFALMRSQPKVDCSPPWWGANRLVAWIWLWSFDLVRAIMEWSLTRIHSLNVS